LLRGRPARRCDDTPEPVCERPASDFVAVGSVVDSGCARYSAAVYGGGQ